MFTAIAGLVAIIVSFATLAPDTPTDPGGTTRSIPVSCDGGGVTDSGSIFRKKRPPAP